MIHVLRILYCDHDLDVNVRWLGDLNQSPRNATTKFSAPPKLGTFPTKMVRLKVGPRDT